MTIAPYLRFNDGKCKEAMAFYADCLGGTTELMTVGESPMAKDMPAEKHGLIMHATFKKDGNEIFFGADMMRDKATIGDNVSVSINCDSEKELKDMFAKLAKGGDVFMEPEEQFWGGVFGVVTDKYGIEWMLNFQKTPMK